MFGRKSQLVSMYTFIKFAISSVLLAWVAFPLHLFCQLCPETPAAMVPDDTENISNVRLYLEIKEIQRQQLRDRVMFLGISFIVMILHVITIIIIIIALYSKDNWITSIFNWMQNLQKYVPAVTENASKNLKKTSHVVYSFGYKLLHKQITFNYKKILHTVVKIICVQRSNL